MSETTPDTNKLIKRRNRRKTIADTSRYYIDKDEYTNEVVKFKEYGVASERLGELFKKHVDRYASASNFKGYTFLDEMKGHALLFLMKYSRSFDLEKGKNAFSYCTTIIHHAFLQIIAKEKKHSELKDKLIKTQDRIDPDRSRFTMLDNMILDDDIEDELIKEESLKEELSKLNK